MHNLVTDQWPRQQTVRVMISYRGQNNLNCKTDKFTEKCQQIWHFLSSYCFLSMVWHWLASRISCGNPWNK